MYLSIDIRGVSDLIMSSVYEERKQALILKDNLKELYHMAYMTEDANRYIYKSCLDKMQRLERRIDERLDLLEIIISDLAKVKQQNEEKFSHIIRLLDSIRDD